MFLRQLVKKLSFFECPWRPSWIYANCGVCPELPTRQPSQIFSLDLWGHESIKKLYTSHGNKVHYRPHRSGYRTNETWLSYCTGAAVLGGALDGKQIYGGASAIQCHFAHVVVVK